MIMKLKLVSIYHIYGAVDAFGLRRFKKNYIFLLTQI